MLQHLRGTMLLHAQQVHKTVWRTLARAETTDYESSVLFIIHFFWLCFSLDSVGLWRETICLYGAVIHTYLNCLL
jgi:hypothetical protein